MIALRSFIGVRIIEVFIRFCIKTQKKKYAKETTREQRKTRAQNKTHKHFLALIKARATATNYKSHHAKTAAAAAQAPFTSRRHPLGRRDDILDHLCRRSRRCECDDQQQQQREKLSTRSNRRGLGHRAVRLEALVRPSATSKSLSTCWKPLLRESDVHGDFSDDARCV